MITYRNKDLPSIPQFNKRERERVREMQPITSEGINNHH